MSRRIRIVNPLVDKTYKTFLSVDYTTAATTDLEVLNSTSFADDDLLVVGEPTQETTEKGTIDTVADINTFTLLASLNFPHNKGTAVYKVLWDFASIESRSSSSGTFAQLSQIPIQWDNKNNETVYYDNNGTNATEYRFRFYNSITLAYAEYSPTITGGGFTKAQVGYMLRNVRSITNDKERKIVDDDELIRYFNTAQDIIYARNPRYWFLKVDTYKDSNGISIVSGTDVYDLDVYSNYGHLSKLRFLYNNGTTQQIYDLEYKPTNEFDRLVSNLTQTGNDYASCYKQVPPDASSEKGYIQIYPKPINAYGTLYPSFYKTMDALDTVDDSTPVPLPYLLENYAISQVEKIKGNDTKARLYEGMFYGTPDKLKDDQVVGGLALLDNMDNANKRPQEQARNLVNFRGQKMNYGNYGRTRDEIKEQEF